jgi:hypothetical protein
MIIIDAVRWELSGGRLVGHGFLYGSTPRIKEMRTGAKSSKEMHMPIALRK